MDKRKCQKCGKIRSRHFLKLGKNGKWGSKEYCEEIGNNIFTPPKMSKEDKKQIKEIRQGLLEG